MINPQGGGNTILICKKVIIWLGSLWTSIENLLQHIVLLFSKSSENQIELV